MNFPAKKGYIHFNKLLGILLLLFWLAGCQTTTPFSSHKNSTLNNDNALVSAFLSFKDSDSPSLKFKITNFEILLADKWISLTNGSVEIDPKLTSTGQFFISRSSLPAGTVTQLRITITNAFITRKNTTQELSIITPTIQIPIYSNLDLNKGDSDSLFLSLDVYKSISNNEFDPQFEIDTSAHVPMIKNLTYVACPKINTIYIIRNDRNWVTGSFSVAGEPIYLEVSADNKKLYVLTSADASIKVIDLSTHILLDDIKIPMTINPSFMALNPDTEWAYILDGRGNYLVKLELATGNMANRIKIGKKPSYILYVEEHQMLALSSMSDQNIYLLDPNSLETLDIISVGSSPGGMLYWDNYLYITESNSNSIALFNLNSRKITGRIHVGFSPRRLFSNSSNIYVANYMDGTISVLEPGKLSVSKNIKAGKRPFELATADSYDWLYAGDVQERGIVTIDTTTNRPVGLVKFDAVPSGIVVIQ